MKKITILIMIIVLMFVSACQQSGIEQQTKSNSNFLKKMNDFYIGTSQEDQSLIHSYIPDNSNKTPVVMVPGLGLGANIYESTPDGRNGWVYDFVETGYPVYTVDTSDLASAGLSDKEAKASLSKWDSQSIWSRWGLGSAPNEPYDNGQFPVKSFEQFYASIPMQVKEVKNNARKSNSSNSPTGSTDGKRAESSENKRRKGGGQSRISQQEVENMIQLLEDTGPSILIVHSMGGEIGYEVARQRPDLVKGIVAIEPVGSPTDEEEIKETFADIPYLGVYGDYLESRNQVNRFKAVQTTVDLINEQGGESKVIRLTEEGINGNSHLMMLDKNSNQISAIITDWLDEKIK